jgi:hypothetical protein
MKVSVDGRWFKDEEGRTLHLRGVNLGGSTKVPQIPNGATWNRVGFYDHRNVSFVGKPFPIEEADEHFSRLKKWGLNFIRFLITWEAIEHAGPGIYDEAYLEYLYAVVKRAADHDLFLFIDPHQDVWSRFSGGDGAPGWTFEVVGMDITKFHQAGAAFTHQEIGDPYPRMMWPSNYSKFACATMFTLFFGGNIFTPEIKVGGVPIQEFLQAHYINAIKQVAERLKGFSHVLGYDTLNEPSQGYIGFPNVNLIPAQMIAQGPSPTIFEGMLLASGFPQEVVEKSFLPIQIISKRKILNSEGISLWMDNAEAIWRKHGVWDVDKNGEPQLLQPEYFSEIKGNEVDFDRDWFASFVDKYSKGIHSVHPEAIIFVSPPPASFRFGKETYSPSGMENIVYAPHWYDGITLGYQRYIPWLCVSVIENKIKFSIGRRKKRKDFRKQIKALIAQFEGRSSGVPTVIGEVGIPYNMNKKFAYKTDDFSRQIMAMDDSLQALESNVVNFTLWNYTADNSNARGDLWNDEDLSIFSRDHQKGTRDAYDGGRALEAVLRPYAYKIPGEPVEMSFDIQTKVFKFSFRLDLKVAAPLEIFVPEFQYSKGFLLDGRDGKFKIDEKRQIVLFFPNLEKKHHHIQISPKLNDDNGTSLGIEPP